MCWQAIIHLPPKQTVVSTTVSDADGSIVRSCCWNALGKTEVEVRQPLCVVANMTVR